MDSELKLSDVEREILDRVIATLDNVLREAMEEPPITYDDKQLAKALRSIPNDSLTLGK